MIAVIRACRRGSSSNVGECLQYFLPWSRRLQQRQTVRILWFICHTQRRYGVLHSPQIRIPVKACLLEYDLVCLGTALLMAPTASPRRSSSFCTLIVFDGLLRSKVFSGDLFLKLRKGIDDAIEDQRKKSRRNIYVAGVAKHSKVLERYQLAMFIEGVK